MFSDVDIETLPKVAEAAVKSALAEPAIWIPIHLRCELCKTDSVRAAVCCADCKRIFCRKHADVSSNGHEFCTPIIMGKKLFIVPCNLNAISFRI